MHDCTVNLDRLAHSQVLLKLTVILISASKRKRADLVAGASSTDFDSISVYIVELSMDPRDLLYFLPPKLQSRENRGLQYSS